jgi:uncharacterized protein (TIGR03083 family)
MPYRGYEGSHLDVERYHAELAAVTARLAEVAAAVQRGPGADRRLPTCPEWTMTDLVTHVGRGLRWAAAIVDARRHVPYAEVTVTVPDEPRQRTEWLLASAARLSDAVRAAGPATPVWTWSADRTAGFWLRRLMHDTLVHRLDAEIAAGREPEVAPDLAADSVSDWLGMVATLAGRAYPDPIAAGLRGRGETLHLHATDEPAGEWLIRRLPTGVEWEPGHVKADVGVRGTAKDLLLVLTRRAAPEDRPVEVLGDGAVLADWLANSAI